MDSGRLDHGFTGYAHVENRFYNGEALGVVIHFNDHNSLWIQESYNKIPTVPLVHHHRNRLHMELVIGVSGLNRNRGTALANQL